MFTVDAYADVFAGQLAVNETMNIVTDMLSTSCDVT